MLPIISVLLCFAADITVRREANGFRISGTTNAQQIAVYVGEGDVPPVLGTFSTQSQSVYFEPRFEISKTIPVRVLVKGQAFHFAAETVQPKPSTVVEQIYPTSNQLPANQLKFYIHFSAPMLNGEAWQNIQLLDANNKPVELAFLEIDQELWDRENRRLTILFDPGRIKRGVTPRDEIGSSLEAGKTYTLKISPAWRDENRTPLLKSFTKSFTVIDEDRTAIDPAKWVLSLPKANTRAPLTIHFKEPIDAALALRLIRFPMSGEARLGPNESSLIFTPDQVWPQGRFEIDIDTALEDLAGNKVGRPFDVDTFDPITVRSNRDIVKLPVSIR